MDKRLVWVGTGLLLLVVLAAALTLQFSKSSTFLGTSYGEPYPAAPAFELTRADGAPFHLADQRGKIVLIFFGYTSCTDVCPITMANMKLLMDRLGEDANSVQVVFISVDPERDTPEKVQEYAAHFDSRFIGLTGSIEQLQPIWDGYGITREVNQTPSAASAAMNMGYEVEHTARLTLIDANGNLRLSYGYPPPVDDIVHDIKLLLR